MDFLINNQKEIIIGIISGLIVGLIMWLISKSQSLPTVELPFWVIVTVITIPLVSLIFSLKPKKLKKIANESFGVERVYIDGKHFTDCKFDGSELVFKGNSPTSMGHCKLTRTRIKFEGSAAVTMQLLSAFYSDPGMRVIAESAFNDVIQKGREISDSRSTTQQNKTTTPTQ